MTIKKFVPALLFLFFSESVFAQDNAVDNSPQVRIGLKGGMSLATIIKTNDNNFSTGTLLGFNGGAVLQLPLGHIIAIQPEVLFSQKGFRSTGTEVGTDYDYKRYLNFLDIPILLRINASKYLGIVVGPQYSYLLGTHTTFKSGDNGFEQDVQNDNNNIRKNIFGGVIGADVNLNHNLFLYGRYTIDFQNNNGDGTSSTPSYKNEVFQFGIGVLL
jgi:hypothetical protein